MKTYRNTIEASPRTPGSRSAVWSASAVILLCTALILPGCTHKELCYDHHHASQLDVVFDWNYAPDAEANNEVSDMCIWFYPIDEDGNRTGDPIYRELSGMKGGKIDIPTGRYCLLYYNSDYESVQFRGIERFLTHECYTREGSIFEAVSGNVSSYGAPRPSGTEDEPVVISPDKMWGDCAINLNIADDGSLSYWFIRDGETERTTVTNSESRVTLMPHEQVCTYTYEIVNVENLKHVTNVCAAISGMAGSVFCVKEELTAQDVTIPVEAVSDGVSVISGSFYTFGHHEANDERHILTVYVWLEDGKKYWYTEDVTAQVDNAPDRRHVHIKVDGLKLPTPIENGSGMHPDVDDWENVDVNIGM